MSCHPKTTDLQPVAFFSSWVCIWAENKEHVRFHDGNSKSVEFGEDVPIRPDEKERKTLLLCECQDLCVLSFQRAFLLLSPCLYF